MENSLIQKNKQTKKQQQQQNNNNNNNNKTKQLFILARDLFIFVLFFFEDFVLAETHIILLSFLVIIAQYLWFYSVVCWRLEYGEWQSLDFCLIRRE